MKSSNRKTILVQLSFVLIALAVSGIFPGQAVAETVKFDSIPLGTLYGMPVGQTPGNTILVEDGVNVVIETLMIAGNPYFNLGKIDTVITSGGTFGSGHTLNENNIDVVFNFNGPGDVTFECLDLGGVVNMQVNGFGPVLEGPDMMSLAGPVAPGVTMNVVPVGFGGGYKALVTLTGPVQSFRVGGQEFWIDNVFCDNGLGGSGSGGCDYEINHESLPLYSSYGIPSGHSPGDYIFSEAGVPVYIDILNWGSGWGFNYCRVESSPVVGFGTLQCMSMNNVSNRYDISVLGISVQKVSFQFADLGGIENLQVNGGTLHINNLVNMPVNVAPGVTMSVTYNSTGSGIYGEVILTGNVQDLLVGGQEFFIDTICIEEGEVAPDCDYLSDYESLSPGSAWGGPYGTPVMSPIFTENSLTAMLHQFDSGFGTNYYIASVGSPWGPIGSGNVLDLNNICVYYDLLPLGPIASVEFDFCAGGGVENLMINGVLYVGTLDMIPSGFFPGVVVNSSITYGPGYYYGTITIDGPVDNIAIGGQQFYMDNLCVMRSHLSAAGDAPELAAKLMENYPNPFNPSTTIKFSLSNDGPTQLTIIDLAGRKVRTLVNEVRSSGDYQVVWDGRDDSGLQAATGMYFVRLQNAETQLTHKITMIK
jgi:hypothetical protein